MSPEQKTVFIDAMAARAPVIPVLTFRSADEGVAVGRALAAGGITVLEVTFRTEAAAAAIEAMRAALPDCLVGAGTVLGADQLAAATRAGAQFLVTPGVTPELIGLLRDSALPALPGCATVSEMLTLRAAGFTRLKFFPAEAAGGAALLRSVAAPVPGVKFCPTGGIDLAKAPAYLALPNVMCVGGSWLTPAGASADEITRLAREACGLR